MLPNVDWNQQVKAGVDEHANALFYYNLLKDRAKYKIANKRQ